MYKHHTLTTRNTIVFPIMLLISTIVSGCVSDGSFGFANSRDGLQPKSKVLDYSTVSCEDIWLVNEPGAYDNALYWLQLMSCSKDVSAKRARELLDEKVGSDWATLFKRSILLAQMSGTDNEQRQTLEKLTKHRKQRSTALKGIESIWVKNQQLQISVNNERLKYQRLKESSDMQVQALNEELQSVNAKLQSLTNIETDILTNRKSVTNGKAGNSAN